MKKEIVFATIVFAALAAGCGSNETQGSGNVVSETRPVSDISIVELSGDTKLDIERTGTESRNNWR